jgi:hypothetical protein
VDFGTKTDIPKSWGLGGLGGCLAPCRELRRFYGAQQERGREGPLRGFPPPPIPPKQPSRRSPFIVSLCGRQAGEAGAFYAHMCLGRVAVLCLCACKNVWDASLNQCSHRARGRASTHELIVNIWCSYAESLVYCRELVRVLSA